MTIRDVASPVPRRSLHLMSIPGRDSGASRSSMRIDVAVSASYPVKSDQCALTRWICRSSSAAINATGAWSRKSHTRPRSVSGIHGDDNATGPGLPVGSYIQDPPLTTRSPRSVYLIGPNRYGSFGQRRENFSLDMGVLLPHIGETRCQRVMRASAIAVPLFLAASCA